VTSEAALRDAKARWARRRRRLITYGQWQPYVDAEPARQHFRNICRTTGMGMDNVTVAAQLPPRFLHYLIYGDKAKGKAPSAQIRTETAEALLAFWPTLDDFFDSAQIDATGTTRRLQALTAIGWTCRAMHPHIGVVHVDSLQRALTRTIVTARLARAVRDMYPWASIGQAEDHGVAPGTAKRTRNRAASLGWMGPAWWDDDELDNPDFVPAVEDTSSLKKVDVTHLLWCGIPNDQVVQRTGASIAYVREVAAELRTGKPRIRSRQTTANDMRKAA